MDELRPVADGLFEWPPNGRQPRLRGSQCRECGEVVFPALRDCPNCGQPDAMSDRWLSGRGRLKEFVVAQRGPEGFAVPYVQAFVQLEDGPVIYSMIGGADAAEPKLEPGMPLMMTIEEIVRDKGTAIVGWKFRRVGAGS